MSNENTNTMPVIVSSDAPSRDYLENIYSTSVTDENLKEITEQYKKDIESNRELRQNVYSKIIKIMICELVFIGILVALMFLIPVLESMGFVTISWIKPLDFAAVFLLCSYLFYSAGFLPSFRFTCKQLHINKVSVNSKRLARVLVILLSYILMLCLPHEKVGLSFGKMHLASDYTGMLIVIETVFVKTTLLLSFIIRGLFKSDNQETAS